MAPGPPLGGLTVIGFGRTVFGCPGVGRDVVKTGGVPPDVTRKTAHTEI